jgi:hypothetical protein
MIGATNPDETIASALGGREARLIPIAIAVATLVVGFVLFRRESPRFPERV